MRTRNRLALSALVVAFASPAWAKDPPKSPVDDLLAKAKGAAGKDPVQAAALYGQAIALAQKARDMGEAAAADALEEMVEDLDRRDAAAAPDATRAAKPGTRAVLAEVMKALDPKRNGAFVTAHALATELLREAVARGDGVFVDEAAAVLLAHEGSAKPEKAAAPLARFAEGMRAVKAGDAAKAAPLLSQAFDAFAANGWLAVALDASTELVALRLAAKDEAKAMEAVAKAAALVQDDSDLETVQTWIANGRARWKGAPDAVLAPFQKVAEKREREAMPGAAGGEGGAGGSGGVDVSPIGRWLAKSSGDQAFVSARRAKEGLWIHTAVQKDATGQLPLRRGQQHWHGDGVTVAVAGWAVALRILDPVGNIGQPGERTRPSKVRAFYLLAAGESWMVSRKGIVTVVAGK